MKTIKIYLNNSGAVSSFDAPNWINQYSYNDTLINIYVPNEILETQTDTETTTYSNGVVMSMLYAQSNGTYRLGNSYGFVYVKNDVVYNGVTYTLFERKMPKEFTLYDGVQDFGISIVAYQTVTENNVTTTSVIGNITSNMFEMTINQALNSVENPIEVDTDISTLEANVNSLLADMPLKQNKDDNSITVRIANNSATTTNNVVTALNLMDLRIREIYTTTTTLSNDLSSLTGRVATLENHEISGFRYVGAYSATDATPDATTLTNFVLSNYTSVNNGDIVLWLDSVTSGTDRSFKCIYSSSWSWYEIPQIELASDNNAGLVKGGQTNNPTAYVNISNGQVTDVKYKDDNNNYNSIADIGTNKQNIANIIGGTQYVRKSTFALYDESEINNANPTPISSKYLTTSSGATKQYVKDYALPKQFNDLYILDLDTDTFSTDVLTSTKTKTVTVSTIGTTLLESATLSTDIYEYQLSNKNGYNFVTQIGSNLDVANVSFIINITYNNNVIGSYETELMSLSANSYTRIRILDWFNEITSPINVTANTTFTIDFYVKQQVSTSIDYTIRTSQASPTILSLSTNYYTISASIRGIDEHIAIGVYDSNSKTLTFEIGNISFVDKTQHFFGLTLPVGEDILSILNDSEVIITCDGVQVPLTFKNNYNNLLSSFTTFYDDTNNAISFYALYDSVNFGGLFIPNVDVAETTYRIPPNEITAIGDDYSLNYNVVSTLYDRKLIIVGSSIGLNDDTLILNPHKYTQISLTEYELIYDVISTDSGAIYYNAISIKTNTTSQTSTLYISNVELATKTYTDTQLATKQDTVSAGTGITIASNVISADDNYVSQASKDYTDNAISNLKWELGTYDLSVDTNTNTAHIKQLPSGAIQTTVSKVEGVGYKVNQLIANGNFEDTSGWGANNGTISANDNELSYTFTTVSNDTYSNRIVYSNISNIPSNTNKYLITFDVYSSKACSLSPYLLSSNVYTPVFDVNANTWTSCNAIVTQSYSRLWLSLYNASSSGFVVGDVVKFRNIQCFDLTTDFGSGNEPSIVSDCASAYLQRGINIYEYTPQQSSIKNNAFTGVTVEGFNKWDEQWELGSIDTTTGEDITSIQYSRNVNTINIKPNTTYYGYSGNNKQLVFYYYDENNNFISFDVATNTTKTTPNNAHYLRIRIDENPYNNDICINVSGSANGTYVPYIAPTTIPIDLTTIKDSNNVSLFPSGKMMGNSSVADFITPTNQESRWDEDDLGSLDWSGSTTRWSATLQGVPNYTNSNLLCIKYTYSSLLVTDVSNAPDKSICCYNNNTIFIKDTDYSTAEALKTALNGVKLQYERATYLTSTTDLTSLVKINVQSNGTITLNNTDNVDMPNTIDTLKEVAK